jgi:F0F1-type ATP synthase delta subunit
MVVVEVSSEELGDTGYSYARIAIEETVDSPLLGGIILFQGRPRYDTTTSTLT